jgi:hypothetical protein
MKTPWELAASAMALLCGAGACLAASADAQRRPEFTGHIAFDVPSDSGRAENIEVTVGDGGRGPYKAVLSGDSSLPTHALYRPHDLRPFGPGKRLPVIAFANGGCRASSGEFRNLLSDVASHGYLVVAIGPAATAAIAGGEDRLATTQASQLLDGITWAEKENARSGSPFYQKLDLAKVAVAGQSCGGSQAIEVSSDPRVKTTLVLNSSASVGRGAPPAAAPTAAAAPAAPVGSATRGEYGVAGTPTNDMMAGLERMARRYVPYGPPSTGFPPRADSSDRLQRLHAPIIYIAGGPSDLAYERAKSDFESITQVPVALLNQDVGHYPATFREPNGGAFSIAVTAWLDWQLRGDASARAMFVGANCGLCKDPKWTVRTRNMN